MKNNFKTNDLVVFEIDGVFFRGNFLDEQKYNECLIFNLKKWDFEKKEWIKHPHYSMTVNLNKIKPFSSLKIKIEI